MRNDAAGTDRIRGRADLFRGLIKAAPNRSPGLVQLDVLGLGPEYRYGPGDCSSAHGRNLPRISRDFAGWPSLGPASPELRRAHADICGIMDAVIDSLRPGVRCRESPRSAIASSKPRPSDCRAQRTVMAAASVSGAAIAQRG